MFGLFAAYIPVAYRLCLSRHFHPHSLHGGEHLWEYEHVIISVTKGGGEKDTGRSSREGKGGAGGVSYVT